MVQKLKKVNHLSRGSKKFLQAHSQSLNLQKILEAALKSVNQIEDQVELFQTLLPLETATGVNLDYWGDLFNVPDRPEDDEEYRQLIYAFIYIYYSEGDALSVQQSLKNAFFCADVRVFDSSPANFEAVMFNPKTPINTTLLTQVLDLVPATGVKPSGVITIPSDPNPDGEFPGGGDPGDPVRYLEFSDNVDLAEANGFYPGTYEAFTQNSVETPGDDALYTDSYSGAELSFTRPDNGMPMGVGLNFDGYSWYVSTLDGNDPGFVPFEFRISDYLPNNDIKYWFTLFDTEGNEWTISEFPDVDNSYMIDLDKIVYYNGDPWDNQVDMAQTYDSDPYYIAQTFPNFEFGNDSFVIKDAGGYTALRNNPSDGLTLTLMEWAPATYVAGAVDFVTGQSTTIPLDSNIKIPDPGPIKVRRYTNSIFVDGVDKFDYLFFKGDLTESVRNGGDWTFTIANAELVYPNDSVDTTIPDGTTVALEDPYFLNTDKLGQSGEFKLENIAMQTTADSIEITSATALYKGVSYPGTAAMAQGYSPNMLTGYDRLDDYYSYFQFPLQPLTLQPGPLEASANKPGHLPVKYLAKEAPQLERTETSIDWATERGSLPSPTDDQANFGYKIDANNDADYPDRDVTNGWRKAFGQYMKYWAEEVGVLERDRVQAVADLLNPLDSKKVTHYDPVREDPAPSYIMPFIGAGTTNSEQYEVRALVYDSALYFENRFNLFMRFEVIDPDNQVRPFLGTGSFSFSPSHMGIKKPPLHLYDGEFNAEELNELERYDYQMIIGGFYVTTGNLSKNEMLIFDRSNTVNGEPTVTTLDLNSLFVFDTADPKKIRTCPLAHHRYGQYVYFITGCPDPTYENATRGVEGGPDTNGPDTCVHKLYRVDLKNPAIENVVSWTVFEIQDGGTRNANPPFWGIVATKNLVFVQLPSSTALDGYHSMGLKFLPVTYNGEAPPWEVPIQDGFLANLYSGQVEGLDIVPISARSDLPAFQSMLYDTPFTESSEYSFDLNQNLIYSNRLMSFGYDYEGTPYNSLVYLTGNKARRDAFKQQLTDNLALGFCTFIVKDKNGVEWKFVGTAQGGNVTDFSYGSGSQTLYAAEFVPAKFAFGGGLELSCEIYKNGTKLADNDTDALAAFAGYMVGDANLYSSNNPSPRFTRSTPGGVSSAQIRFDIEQNPDTGAEELIPYYTGGWQATSRAQVNMDETGRLAILSRGQYLFSPSGKMMLGMGFYPINGIFLNRKPFFHVYQYQPVSKEVTDFSYIEYDDPYAKLDVYNNTNAYGNYSGVSSVIATSRENFGSRVYYLGLTMDRDVKPDEDSVVVVEIDDFSITKVASQLSFGDMSDYFDKVTSIFVMPEISTCMKMVFITPGNMPVRALANPGRRYSVCFPGYMGKTDYQLKYKITSPVITMSEADVSEVTFEKIPDAVETSVNKIQGVSKITNLTTSDELDYERGDTTVTVATSQGEQFQSEISGWWDPYYIYGDNPWSARAAIQNPTQYLLAKEDLSPSELNGLNVSDALDILYGKLSDRNAATFYTRRFTDVALDGSKNAVITHDLDTTDFLISVYQGGLEVTYSSTISATDSETISITCANSGNIDVIIRG